MTPDSWGPDRNASHIFCHARCRNFSEGKQNKSYDVFNFFPIIDNHSHQGSGVCDVQCKNKERSHATPKSTITPPFVHMDRNTIWSFVSHVERLSLSCDNASHKDLVLPTNNVSAAIVIPAPTNSLLIVTLSVSFGKRKNNLSCFANSSNESPVVHVSFVIFVSSPWTGT